MKRIAITGLGMVTPLGLSAGESWSRLLRGTRAGRWLSPAELNTDSPHLPKGTGWFGAKVPLETTAESRLIAFAEIAADEAIRQSQVDPDLLHLAGCVIGTSKQDLRAIEASSPGIDAWFPGQAASHLSRRYGCTGAALAPVAACATGLVSLIRGASLIREGLCSTVLAGSADASLHAGILASYQRLGVLANPGQDPAECCRPFDLQRTGFLAGEGAAVFVLEDWEQARWRGATILAEWLTGCVLGDPTGMTLVDGTGQPLVRAMRRLLDQTANCPTSRLGISLHGTATLLNDRAEGTAIREVFGPLEAAPRCFGVKGAIGHLMGAAGSVELGYSLLALRDQVLPPSVNYRSFDESCGLALESSAVELRLDRVLKLSLGFGGHVAAALVHRVT